MDALRREQRAFEAALAELLEEHVGEYVVFRFRAWSRRLSPDKGS